jgi:predicted transcriptional regulator
MPKAILVCCVLLSLAAPSGLGQQTANLDFLPSAEVGPQVELERANWALLATADGAFANISGSLGLAAPAQQIRHRISTVWGAGEPLGESPPADPATDDNPQPFSASELDLLGIGPASLFIEAEEIRWASSELVAKIEGISQGACLNSFVPPDILQSRNARFETHCPGPTVITGGTAGNLTMEARGVHRIEMHGLQTTCYHMSTGYCPDGRDVDSHSFGNELASVHAKTFQYHEFQFGESNAPNLLLNISKTYVSAGSQDLTLRFSGHGRFPLAHGQDCPFTCPEQETLRVAGSGRLTQLRWDAPKLSAGLRSDSGTIYLDERVAGWTRPPQPLAAATATVAALAIIKFLVAPFFTRLSKEQALEHPRRRKVFEYIQQNPGANFREVARRTGIAAGTVRHHLNVLARSDIIVEHQHGSTVRLFENLSKFQANWADHVLLREPSLGELYDWLKANPGAPQKAVLEGMEPQGWSRSTTQHRLSRLVEGGLATIRLQGRLKIYTALDRSSNPPAPS